STRPPVRPFQASCTEAPASRAVSVGAVGGGGGGGAPATARRIAPLVGPRVTELTVEPPRVAYVPPRLTVTVEEVGLTTTVPPLKFRRQAEPTWKRAPTGEPTSAVQLAL